MYNRALDPVLMEMLVCLADEGSFTVAADRLHLTQQAVSAQMKRLEDLMGQRIVTRSPKTIRLTQAGEALLVYARQVVTITERVRRQFSHVPLEGSIRFGFSPGFGLPMLFPVLTEIRRLHPRLELYCEARRTTELLPKFHAGNLDVIVGAQKVGDCVGEVMLRENLSWVGNAKELVVSGMPVPLVMLPNPTFLRDQILTTLAAANLSWTIFFESDDAMVIRAAVMSGWGMSVFNRAVLAGEERLVAEAGSTLLPDPGQIEFFMLSSRNSDGPCDSFANVLRVVIAEMRNADACGRDVSASRRAVSTAEAARRSH